jgi:pimeloyl-ACP methyl ester carboxylesterase
MPTTTVDGLTINYSDQGDGEPLLLIPYLGADNACYAFQFESHTAQYRCLSIDLPGSGESDAAPGPITTEWYADIAAGFLTSVGVERAHVAGVSLGGAVGMLLAARHPDRVASLGLHSTWPATDSYVRVTVAMWRSLARHADSVADAVVGGIFPFCFTPEMYSDRPDFVQVLDDFVHGRPAQSLANFLAQSDAVLAHDAAGVLGQIAAPTLITFGAHDVVTSTRFAEPLHIGISGSQVVVFDQLSHAGLHEDPETFNSASLDFLARQHL